jgi:hypothetical protein
MTHYVHTQIGYVMIAIYAVLILIVGYLIRDAELNLAAQAGLVVLLIALLTFTTLKVSVDQQKVQIRFGLGIFSKGFLLSEIETCEVVMNRWYYGWGIRYTPHGWLYCVSGLTAVELQMKNGKRYRIGTDDPDGLASAIHEGLRGLVDAAAAGS